MHTNVNTHMCVQKVGVMRRGGMCAHKCQYAHVCTEGRSDA